MALIVIKTYYMWAKPMIWSERWKCSKYQLKARIECSLWSIATSTVFSSEHPTLAMISDDFDNETLSTTTLASENVPIPYAEFSTSSWYWKSWHPIWNWNWNRGCSGSLLSNHAISGCFHCTGIRRQEMRFGDMKYGTVYDGSVVALIGLSCRPLSCEAWVQMSCQLCRASVGTIEHDH